MNDFLFATGIECSYPTIEHGTWRIDELDSTRHYRYWRRDLELMTEMGLTWLRYGPPLHLIFEGPGKYDWSFLDAVCARMKELGIIPIMDLCHFGLPDWLGTFQNPEFPGALADYAEAFSKRYPWVRHYTPVNEMYVTARMSALDGVWNEQLRSERAFVTASSNLARASALMMDRIQRNKPDAIFINSESSEYFQPCCPDPRIRQIADFENQRRFIPLDLLYGREVRQDVHRYLLENGVEQRDYAWFMNQPAHKRAVLGIDYYVWNEKLIDIDGNHKQLGELFGWYVITAQYYERYKRPIMHTETNSADAAAAPAWLWRQWHNVQLIRKAGVPVIGFTWYSLQDQVDWDIGLAKPNGNVTPVGLYDLNRDPRPVALAYKYLISMYKRDPELALGEIPQIFGEAA